MVEHASFVTLNKEEIRINNIPIQPTSKTLLKNEVQSTLI